MVPHYIYGPLQADIWARANGVIWQQGKIPEIGLETGQGLGEGEDEDGTRGRLRLWIMQ